MSNYESYKKCKICNKNIILSNYKVHKKNCESKIILNPNS